MRHSIVLAVWTLAGAAMAQPSGTYDIRAYGALGGDRLDTAAIQKAVDAAWRAGGGEVVVPETRGDRDARGQTPCDDPLRQDPLRRPFDGMSADSTLSEP